MKKHIPSTNQQKAVVIALPASWWMAPQPLHIKVARKLSGFFKRLF